MGLRLKQKGFSMIELLVVLLIIGILAAIAAPMFMANADKAKVSEAVAGLGAIRSAQRVYYMQNSNAYTVDGVIYNTGASTEIGAILGLTFPGAKYFSNTAYAFDNGAATFSDGVAAVNFLIGANGSETASTGQYAGANKALAAGGATGARSYTEVANMKVEMDNSGRIIYSLDNGTTWKAY